MFKKGNMRRTYLIDKKFQTQFILKFCALVIIGSFLVGVLLYCLSLSSTTVAFRHSRASVQSTADFLLPLLVQTIIVVGIVVAVATIILVLLISNRIAGPLYRLKRELTSISMGNFTGDFSIRKGDHLQDIAASMSGMITGLREKIGNLKNDWCMLKDIWEVLLNKESLSSLKDDKDIAQIKDIIIQMDKDFDYFKIQK